MFKEGRIIWGNIAYRLSFTSIYLSTNGYNFTYCCCSGTHSYLTLGFHGLQHAMFPCPSLSPRVGSNSCPLSPWGHPTISSSVAPFFSCPQSFLGSRYFPMSQLFTSDGQSTGASASPSVLPMRIQGLFHLVLIGLISLMSKKLSSVFSSTTVRKHQFFGASLLYGPTHICTVLL